MTWAIRAEGLCKQYRIGAAVERETTMRDAIARAAGAPLRAARRLRHPRGRRTLRPLFHALRDVSFEIRPGEVVGIIGPNGAGKSTLLKVLSRITEPSSGLAEIRGRVASLLEVGTGFHQELTGRENIFLNGAILGMRRAETARKFDEIVEFAEVGPFIDTPIKHYSTGMHLRLAFSVAAHLEPDILLVDEVLAVGDLAFQRKCLGRMERVAAAGRTVLFVSHNLAAIKQLCESSMVLHRGELVYRGGVAAGLAHYSRSLLQDDPAAPLETTRWSSISVDGRSQAAPLAVHNDRRFDVCATLDVSDDLIAARLFFLIYDASGDLVVHARVSSGDLGAPRLERGRYELTVGSPPLWLAPGVYTMHFKLIATTSAGREARHVSDRVLLDVSGQADGIGGARLAPTIDWSLAPASCHAAAAR
jgi:lipopolysaccharide transport system ATP-binding protein